MRGTLVLLDDFRGGVNFRDAPYSVDPKQARDLLNVVGHARGAIRKRDGATLFLTVAGEPSTLPFKGLFASPNPDVMVGAFEFAGNHSLGRVAPDGDGATIKTGLASSDGWQFVHAPATGGQGPIWGMNGVDTPQQWDGVAGLSSNWTASAGTLPNGRFCVMAGNRLWVAGVPGDPTAVFWSEIRDVRNWPAANVTRFASEDGGDITGLGVVGPYVLVFKRDRAWVIYDLDTSANRALDGGAGCVAHRSIAESPEGTFFLASDGVYMTDGNTARKVSAPVDPLLEQAVDEAAGKAFDGHYYLSIVYGGVAPDRTLDYDLELKSWWVHSLAAHEWATFDAGQGLELFGATPGGVARAFVAGELQDLGVVFPGYWASAFHHFGSPSLRKRLRQVHFDGSGLIQFAVARDFLGEGDTYATAATSDSDGDFGVDDGGLFGAEDGVVFGGFATVAEARAFSLGVGRAWSLKFGNDTAERFEIDSYTCALTQRRN